MWVLDLEFLFHNRIKSSQDNIVICILSLLFNKMGIIVFLIKEFLGSKWRRRDDLANIFWGLASPKFLFRRGREWLIWKPLLHQ